MNGLPNAGMYRPASVGMDIFSNDHMNVTMNVSSDTHLNIMVNVRSDITPSVYPDTKMRSSTVVWGAPPSDSGHDTSSDADDYLNVNPWGANALFSHSGGRRVPGGASGRYLPAVGPSNSYPEPSAPLRNPLQFPYTQGNLAPSQPQSRMMVNIPPPRIGGYRDGDGGSYLPPDANVYHQPPYTIHTPQGIPMAPVGLSRPSTSAPHPGQEILIPLVGLNHSLPSVPHPGGTSLTS